MQRSVNIKMFITLLCAALDLQNTKKMRTWTLALACFYHLLFIHSNDSKSLLRSKKAHLKDTPDRLKSTISKDISSCFKIVALYLDQNLN